MSALTLGGEDVDSAEGALKAWRVDDVDKSALNECIMPFHHVTTFSFPSGDILPSSSTLSDLQFDILASSSPIRISNNQLAIA